MTIKEQVRFGIPAKQTQHKGGILKITPQPTEEVQLILRNEADTLRSVFPSKFYTPYLFFPGESPPQDYIKVRFLFEIGEVIIYPSEKRFSINFYFNQARESQSLQEHTNLWRVVNIFQDAKDAGFILEIPGKGKFRVKEINFPQVDKNLLNIATVVDNAWFLCRYFDISPDTEITLGQILKQKYLLEELRRICDVKYPISAIGFQIIDAPQKKEKEIAVALLRNLVLGTNSIIISVGLAGSLNKTNDEGIGKREFRIENPRSIFLDHFISKSNKSISYELQLEKLSEKLENKGYNVIVIHDWESD